jgi:hypothetical protein
MLLLLPCCAGIPPTAGVHVLAQQRDGVYTLKTCILDSRSAPDDGAFVFLGLYKGLWLGYGRVRLLRKPQRHTILFC